MVSFVACSAHIQFKLLLECLGDLGSNSALQIIDLVSVFSKLARKEADGFDLLEFLADIKVNKVLDELLALIVGDLVACQSVVQLLARFLILAL